MARRSKPAPCVEPVVYVTSGSSRKVHRLRTDGDSKCGLVGEYARRTYGRTLEGKAIDYEDAAHRRQVCINCFPDGLLGAPKTPLGEAELAEAREYAEQMYELAKTYVDVYLDLVGGDLHVQRPPWLELEGGVEIGKEEGIEDE